MGHWLSHQHDEQSRDQPFRLVETWDIDHVNIGIEVYATNRFSISKSKGVAMSSFESPSLSVMYPGTDKPPVILSKDAIYRSATFVEVSGQEYLAAACREDGCLYLWDIQSKASEKVFDPKLPKNRQYKPMNICKLRDNIIGYGEVFASPDGSRRVFILNTEKEELTLSSTLRLFTSKNIYDMSYIEVDGGTACLLLCVPNSHSITAVEMIGGRTRWEVGKEQMGEECIPWSVCTDDDNTIYVADYKQNMIHLLSAEDGSVVTSISLPHYGIANPFAVRFHDQCLYVKHCPNPDSKYAISKFKREI